MRALEPRHGTNLGSRPMRQNTAPLPMRFALVVDLNSAMMTILEPETQFLSRNIWNNGSKQDAYGFPKTNAQRPGIWKPSC